jgi:hypothetical protein
MNNYDTFLMVGGCLAILLWIAFGILSLFNKTQIEEKRETATNPPQQATPAQPAPAPTVDSGGVSLQTLWPYLWPALLIGTILYVWGWKDTPTHKAGPAPQAQAPKRELQRRVITRPIEFLGGENLTRGREWIGIQQGGHANFRVDLPIVQNGKYKIHFHMRRVEKGRDFIEINRGKENNGNPFSVEHNATDFPIEIVFFDDGYVIGMPGEPKYFRPGDNFFKLWADKELLIQLNKPMYVKITYWE